MKAQTANLQDKALDLAVAYAMGYGLDASDPGDVWLTQDGISVFPLANYKPSTNWGFGGLIIDSENITVCWQGAVWVGSKFNVRVDGEYEFQQQGSTPLIAAMRCFVASKLGDTVDIPDELL